MNMNTTMTMMVMMVMMVMMMLMVVMTMMVMVMMMMMMMMVMVVVMMMMMMMVTMMMVMVMAMAMNMNAKKKKKIMMMARMVMGADAADKRPYITRKSYVPGGQWKPTGPKPPMSRKLWHDKAKTQRHLKMISISMHHEPRSSRLTSGGHSWRKTLCNETACSQHGGLNNMRKLQSQAPLKLKSCIPWAVWSLLCFIKGPTQSKTYEICGTDIPHNWAFPV